MAEPLTYNRLRPRDLPNLGLQKAEGAFLALAAGDALGWPQEVRGRARGAKAQRPSVNFREWFRRGGDRFHPFEEKIGAGEYSDDTQLTLAVARSRLTPNDEWWTAFTTSELPLWTLYERGGGGAVKRAAASWLRGIPPWKHPRPEAATQYFRAGGNGVAMRVLPHAVFHRDGDSFQLLSQDVLLDGIATHGHPRALLGATAFAYACWYLLRLETTLPFGELAHAVHAGVAEWATFTAPREGWSEAAEGAFADGYAAAWEEGKCELLALLDRVTAELEEGALADDERLLRDLGCFDPEVNGAGTVNAAAAIYLCSRFATQPVHGVLTAAFASRADTDTLAAMTGALAGCLSGSDWLPREWWGVQDANYLGALARDVFFAPDAAANRPLPQPIRQTDLKRILASLAASSGSTVKLNGVDFAVIEGEAQLSSSTRARALREIKLRCSTGQTVYVRVSPLPAPTPVSPSTTAVSNQLSGSIAVRPVLSVRLKVKDLRPAVEFYEGLGLVALRRAADYVDLGALLLVKDQRDVSAQNVLPFPEASRGPEVILSIPNWHEVSARLAAAGVRTRELLPLTSGQRRLQCTDPAGHPIELQEAPSRKTG